MIRTRLPVALLMAAAVTTSCAESPTSVQQARTTRPAFNGGGYMANGARSVTPDSTGTSGVTAEGTAGTDSTTTVTSPAIAGGGYAGNGG